MEDDHQFSRMQDHPSMKILSRRALLRRGAALGFAIPAISALLAACGGSDSDSSGAATSSTSGNATTQATPTTEKKNETPATTEVKGTPTAASEKPSTSSTEAATQASGKLVVVRSDEPPTLDWKDITNEPQTFVARSVMEALTVKDPVTLQTSSLLAEDWTWDNENLWTFRLRKGVKFHNGEPFNADCVVYTYERIADPDVKAQLAYHLSNMKSVKAVDEATVEVETVKPDPIFDARAGFIPIAPIKFSQEKPDQLPTTMIGTGPYKLAEFQPGQVLRLEADNEYWGEKASIAEIEILFRDDASVRALMVQTGEADLAWTISPESIESAPAIVQYPGISVVGMRPDTSGANPTLADARIRQAMLYAVDQETLIATMLDGVAERVLGNQPIPPVATGYDPDMEPWPYDLDKARELIAAAKADGVPLDTPITINQRGTGWFPRQSELAEYLTTAWREVGLVNVDIQVLDSQAWVDAHFATGPNEDHADLSYALMSCELMDYTHIADRYLYCDGSVSMFCDPEVDGMIHDAAKLAGEERVEAFQAVSLHLKDIVPLLIFGTMLQTHAIAKNLKWDPRPDGYPNFSQMSFSA